MHAASLWRMLLPRTQGTRFYFGNFGQEIVEEVSPVTTNFYIFGSDVPIETRRRGLANTSKKSSKWQILSAQEFFGAQFGFDFARPLNYHPPLETIFAVLSQSPVSH
jgi:hypothetical protein